MGGDAEEDANGLGAYGAGVSVCLEQVLVEVTSGADAGLVKEFSRRIDLYPL